jgi:inorganic pyrophosphatase
MPVPPRYQIEIFVFFFSWCYSLQQVKVLGALCLIDQGEADWKVVAINVNDPLAERLNGP